ncbi:MAG: hypothetical protein HY758_01795, partial [Nitrospirae bacterium]|nr:hypothetical protein [Nitrospirota bacterium]
MKKGMKSLSIVVYLLARVFVFSLQAHADLELRGEGTSAYGTFRLIYDTDLDITWYDYTFPAYSNGKLQMWQDQMNSVSSLSVNFGGIAYDGWRFPSAGYLGAVGYNLTNSEMGHLYYTELGNKGYTYTNGCGTGGSSSPCLSNTGDFQNLMATRYWTGTEDDLYPYPYVDGSQNNGYFEAPVFNTADGEQTVGPTRLKYSAIAVHDGNVTVV